MNYRAAPDQIDKLGPNQVFVYGANDQGRHGKGAALTALNKFGAEYGFTGRTFQTYGIETCTLVWGRDHGLGRVTQNIKDFLAYAFLHPEDEFLVTPVGCGLAGYRPDQIAPLFRDCPENVLLPRIFIEILEREVEPA